MIFGSSIIAATRPTAAQTTAAKKPTTHSAPGRSPPGHTPAGDAPTGSSLTGGSLTGSSASDRVPEGRDCSEAAIASLILKQGDGAISLTKATHTISSLCGLTTGQSLAALIAIGAGGVGPDHNRGHARLATIAAQLKSDHDYAVDLRAIVATETMLLIQDDMRQRALAMRREGAAADKAVGAKSRAITMDAVILRTAIALYFGLDKGLVKSSRGGPGQRRNKAGAQRLARWLDDAAAGYCAITQKTESKVFSTRSDRLDIEFHEDFSGETPSWAWGYVVFLDQDGGRQSGDRAKGQGADQSHRLDKEETESAGKNEGFTRVIHTPPPRRDHALRNAVEKLLTGIYGAAPNIAVAENLMAAAIERLRVDGDGLIEAAEALDVLSVRAALVHVTNAQHGATARIEPAAGRTLQQCRISVAKLLADHTAIRESAMNGGDTDGGDTDGDEDPGGGHGDPMNERRFGDERESPEDRDPE